MSIRPLVRTLHGCRPHVVRPALFVSVIGLALFVISIASFALAAATFPDVPPSHPYYAAINDLATRSIIGGYANGEFGPSDAVTRQQFAKMIVLTADYPVSESDVCPFRDVVKGDATSFYPDNYVAVCAARGVTTGKTPTMFDPLGKITRHQVVTMVVRTADDLRPGLLASPPAGWAGSSAWTNDATHGLSAARAQYNGLLEGLDLAILSPSGEMNRGEVAQVLHNLLGKLAPAEPTTTSTQSTTTTAASSTTSTQSTTTTIASSTTSTTSALSKIDVVVGQMQSFTLVLKDASGAPVVGLSVEWYMEGVGYLVADDAGDTSDPNDPALNRDYDISDADGRVSVIAKSDVPGEQIIHAKIHSGGSFVIYTYYLEWH